MSTDLDFKHKHYVPILKTKAGEQWALSNASQQTRNHLTPLLEVHVHKSKDNGTHVGDVCEALSTTWGTDDPFFLDTIWLHSNSTNVPALVADTFQAARDSALEAIPVVRLSYDAVTLAQIRGIVEEDQRGCLLRISQDDLDGNSTARIDTWLGAVGLAAGDVHLLLDYDKSRMQLRGDVPRIPFLSDWRTFTAASGMFPASLVSLPPGIWNVVPRRDWTTWEADIVSGGLTRRPAFGDYTTRAPGPPAVFGDPVVNMRYTTDQQWLVRVGGKFKQGAATQITAICADLIARAEYAGRGFSAGDAKIADTAVTGTSTGSPTQWVQWSVSHHLAFADAQIQNHPSL